MSDEKKISLEALEDYLVKDQEKSSFFNFSNLWTIIVLNWQWFLLSLLICMLSGWLYLRYTMPTYQMSARVLIKSDNSKSSNVSQVQSETQEFGFLSNSTGIENEVEVLRSRVLLREVVKDLKLYVEYRLVGQIIKPLIYQTQPLNVELDPIHLDSLDKTLLLGSRSIVMELSKAGDYYIVNGQLLPDNKTFAKKFKSLPASFKTHYGVLTFTVNGASQMKEDETYEILLSPPMQVATRYLNALSVDPVSKQTSVARLTVKDENYQRGMDFLRHLALCYNRQANADKNEVAVRTEEFINERLTKINGELGSTDGALESYKRRNRLVELKTDARESSANASVYEQKLNDINTQIALIDDVSSAVNTSNRSQLLPTVGLQDASANQLINEYNKIAMDRNRLLRTAAENSPIVEPLTEQLDEINSSIKHPQEKNGNKPSMKDSNCQKYYVRYNPFLSV